jgi:benzoate transport
MNIDVGKVIDEAKLNSYHVVLALLCFLFTIVEGYEMICLGMITKEIAQDWNINPKDLTFAHTAVLIGILVGSFVAGVLTDKLGRRKSLLIMITIATAGMGLSFWITNMPQLVSLRFLTGFGAGGALPIAVALVSEYAPRKYRNVMVIFAYAGAPFASWVGGYMGNYFIANFGWQGMFLLGFILALPILIWMFLWVPESVKYLVVAGKDEDKAKALIRRANPQVKIESGDTLFINEPPLTKGSIASLFSDKRFLTTILLWVAFIGGQVTVYLMSIWLPTFLQNAGWEADLSRQAVGHYYLGASIGGIIIGVLADKFGAAKVIITTFPIAAVLYFFLGQTVDNIDVWWIIAPFAGAFAVGGIMALAPFATELYPTSIRGTGVGAALGVGRIGSILAPAIGSALLAYGIGAAGFYNAAMIAPILCSLSIFLLVFFKKRN